MSDLTTAGTIQQIQSDSQSLRKVGAFYNKMIKEFHVQKRGSFGPPAYAMTLYFQGALEDEAKFYDRVADFLDERATELINSEYDDD